ncbi:hypothetical protein NNJEOMEG_00882 [Fundidesulfovibrio magnetotacticus]|uniref:Uncharacterized protein n=1 Tax=Fundidesulfovibrio magnetotacticus TaxID=2730080 RepID=A0A6V8LK13_9BACT|nr:hypothetical protein [Fundidesulfovibrio magnetotacticus]GFK93053.1 hypothetical protein NNJEOMEG_00882 [Fundidesulfovibrio magnetotacticus]
MEQFWRYTVTWLMGACAVTLAGGPLLRLVAWRVFKVRLATGRCAAALLAGVAGSLALPGFLVLVAVWTGLRFPGVQAEYLACAGGLAASSWVLSRGRDASGARLDLGRAALSILMVAAALTFTGAVFALMMA